MSQWLQGVHPQWRKILEQALNCMDAKYLLELQASKDWLPGASSLLAAFSVPLSSVRFILLGESPYPRPQSANGYAFWDNTVGSLWSATGLSKEVNRATSLRNLIKMLLYARGDLRSDFSQSAIECLDKSLYVQTAHEFFQGLLSKGFLLLNASLVYSVGHVNYHARQWRPFIHEVLTQLAASKTRPKLIVLGKIAQQLPEIHCFMSLIAEHPYNISFITNPAVVSFFKPLDLLANDQSK